MESILENRKLFKTYDIKLGRTKMNMYTTFVSKPSKLADTLLNLSMQSMPKVLDIDFLKNLGLSKREPILFKSLLKKLGLIDDNCVPVEDLYSRFIESENSSKQVIAKLVRTKYKELFQLNKEAYKLPKDKIKALMREIMGAKKSNTIVEMVTNTFCALSYYADWSTIKNIEEEFNNSIGETNKQEFELEVNNHTNSNRLIEQKAPRSNFINELIEGVTDHEYNGKVTRFDRLLYESTKVGQLDIYKNKNTDSPARDLNVEKLKHKKESVNSGDMLDEDLDRGDNTANRSRMASNLGTDKNFINALLKKAELLLKLERKEEAVTALNDIITYSKEHSGLIEDKKILEMYYKKASLLEELNKYEEALTNYDTYLQKTA
ncbi:MAG: DUF5343 domain-containing protein [Balneola sp.]|nr:DUF5343 domain-containing protein [Balneola sp.]MBO6650925.1 DUF5343 domain-containing protein [Balneola sp.]MBO6711867.1 DUF5343 domain-containing protein [Balneola sp.]MBO6800062.1 DUF5343 domain-containing protein [Balneola sp.]MBO6871557.1 DUF5343 domain-containing protein [Balneola sp.]